MRATNLSLVPMGPWINAILSDQRSQRKPISNLKPPIVLRFTPGLLQVLDTGGKNASKAADESSFPANIARSKYPILSHVPHHLLERWMCSQKMMR
jgi:hypothetical protein